MQHTVVIKPVYVRKPSRYHSASIRRIVNSFSYLHYFFLSLNFLSLLKSMSSLCTITQPSGTLLCIIPEPWTVTTIYVYLLVVALS
jgi:hypothetical protein